MPAGRKLRQMIRSAGAQVQAHPAGQVAAAAHRRQRDGHGGPLAGHGSAGHSQGRRTQPAENKDGVQHHVDGGPGHLGQHGDEGVAPGLQQLGAVGLDEQPQRPGQDHLRVLDALLPDHGLVR